MSGLAWTTLSSRFPALYLWTYPSCERSAQSRSIRTVGTYWKSAFHLNIMYPLRNIVYNP